MGRYNKGIGKQIKLKGVVGGMLLGAALAAGTTNVYAAEDDMFTNAAVAATDASGKIEENETASTTVVKHYYEIDGYGWLKSGNRLVYMKENGTRYRNCWMQDVDEKWYFFDKSGFMVTGFVDWKGQKFYLNNDGSMYEGWLKLEEAVYYFRPDNGDMFVGEQLVEGVVYNFGTDGKAVGITEIPVKKVENVPAEVILPEVEGDITEAVTPEVEEFKTIYYAEAGYGWKQNEDGSWSYINKDGTMALYWLLDDAKNRYFLGADGRRQTGILILDNIPYNFGDDGILLTGWQTYNDATYFFDPVTGIPATGVVLIDGIQYGFNAEYKLDMSVIPWDLVLVNYQNYMPENYQIPLRKVNGYNVDTRMAAYLSAMINAAKKDGVNLKITSAYRTIATQTRLYNNGLTNRLNAGMSYEAAVAERNLYNAEPGKSEHNLGLAIDFISGGALTEAFANSSQAAWLSEHAHEYGFILRYEADKVDVTKIAWEPWHYRYVGVNTATYIHEHNICFEELFVNYYTEAPVINETVEITDETSNETVEVLN